MSKHLLLNLLSFLFCLFSLSWSQTMWTKYPGNPVLNTGPSGTWEQTAVAQPSVKYDGTTYHMWYGGLSSFNDLTSQIGYATSSDGKNWTKYASNPVFSGGGTGAWDRGVGPGSVILVNGIYHLYYTGYDGTYYRIGHATSTDKVSWTRDPNNPILNLGPSGTWDDWWVSIPSVIFNGSTFHMWYAGYDGTHDRIGYATSPDGSTWTKHSSNPVVDLGAGGSWDDWWTSGCSVLFNGSSYEMWYSGHDGSRVRIGYVTSPDGIIWDKYIYNPVLDVGLSGSWDQYWVWCPKVVFNGSDYKMWYQGQSSGNTCLVGYATAPVTINVPSDVPTIQAGIDSASDGNIVLVEDGTYLENINFKGKSITVASHFLVAGDTSHISNTIIDGSQPSHPDSGSVVHIISGEDSTTTLTGFTLTHGTGTISSFQGSIYNGGGGIFVDSSSCVIKNNKIINNSLSSRGLDCMGAGIEVNYSNCIIEKNIIRYNVINEPNNWAGGAGIDINGNSVILRDNIISENTIISNWGPGAGLSVYQWTQSDTILIEDNIIERNIYNSSQLAAGGGLGILYCKGQVIVSGNVISHNESHGSASHLNGEAGGIYIENCSPVISNNIISNNKAGHGGGITVCYYSGFEPQPTIPLIINNTLTRNSARRGGGIYSYGSQAYPKIKNTILWKDSASVSDPEIYKESGQITVEYSDIEGGYFGVGNIDMDPFFYDSLMNPGDTMFCCLAINSPCIDAGNPHSNYNDIEDPLNPGFALWPAMGTSTNDMGAYGGPYDPNIFVGIKQKINESHVVQQYQLYQNYPNPFNPATIIAFYLPTRSKVTLKIFNILGEEVSTLLTASLHSGYYQYEWDASSIASGVYLYRLQAGDYVKTKKMVLMR